MIIESLDQSFYRNPKIREKLLNLNYIENYQFQKLSIPKIMNKYLQQKNGKIMNEIAKISLALNFYD